jgi:Fe2+ or Zn2+ uptake regulation protein
VKRLSAGDWKRLAEVRGLKLTPQRRAIVDYLQTADHHPTPEEVLNAINRRFPMTSRATVYNTLNMLKEEGLVREVFEDGVSRFDPNLSPHHHFVCDRCGAVEDVEWEAVPAVGAIALSGGQKVETFSVTLRGLCAVCQREQSGAPSPIH